MHINLYSHRHASKVLDKKIAETSEDVQFLKQEVKVSVEKLADLRFSSIALEDQKIRLLRQQHFLKQQQKFIQLQSKQWAREQLLLSALRFEKSAVEGVLDSWRALSSTISESECLFKKYLVYFKLSNCILSTLISVFFYCSLRWRITAQPWRVHLIELLYRGQMWFCYLC